MNQQTGCLHYAVLTSLNDDYSLQDEINPSSPKLLLVRVFLIKAMEIMVSTECLATGSFLSFFTFVGTKSRDAGQAGLEPTVLWGRLVFLQVTGRHPVGPRTVGPT